MYRVIAMICALQISCAPTGSLVPYEEKPVYDPSPKYYSVLVMAEKKLRPEAFNQEVNRLANDAPDVLALGRKVVIYPPDYCRTTTAAPAGAEQAKYIEMQCGVLISSLERQLGLAGYQVVSWQVLRAADRINFIDRARNIGVDVVFEIDQLSENDRVSGMIEGGMLEIFEYESKDKRTPITASQEVGLRCKERAEPLLAELDRAELSATLAVKAVEVESGRAVWYYNKTMIAEQEKGASQLREEWFFKASPSYERPPKMPKYDDAQLEAKKYKSPAGGIILTALGGAVVMTGLMFMLTRPFDKNESDDSNISMAIGASASATGFLMLLPGVIEITNPPDLDEFNDDAITWNERTFPPPKYPSPENVICSGRALDSPWASGQEPGKSEPKDSSAFVFGGSASGTRDDEKYAAEKLFRRISKDFAQELLALASEASPKPPSSTRPESKPQPSPEPTRSQPTE